MRRRSGPIGVCLVIGALGACASNSESLSSADTGVVSPDAASDCPNAQEALDGKITDADRTRFETTSGAMVVLITVAGGAQSALPECPNRAASCPELDAAISQMEAENLASQRCVRALIASVGGTADPTSFWLIDAFTATLTWDQIQMVAAHPHVIHVESNGGTPPP